jgi:eukaryotic-like serine/threonine-protein kinase
MTGQKIAHYEILDKIGEGGMGKVYKARDTRLNRIAAIKVLPPDRMADAARRARFIQEAQAASALNHPNIVTIYGIERDGDADFIAMEYLPGRTLEQVINRRGLDLRDTLKYAIQIADALAAAHAAGIVHRDLKPGNVMVSETGVVKVLDFGLAKLTDAPEASADDATRTVHAQAPVTEKGAVLGTVSYMSPEQAEGKPIDARSDIFSFGSLLYEMVTGKRAFEGDSKMSTISSILRDDPKPGSQTAGHAIPRDLEKIVSRCLRKDRSRRFQHIDDVKVALEELKEESDSGLLTPAELPSRAASRWPLVAVGIAIILALGLGAAYLRQPGERASGTPGLKLRQITQDAGYTGSPAISPDGKLLAYASDRGGDAAMDIWVQQLGRGSQPIRLTKNAGDEGLPSFSPDGGQIVFASRREGGGIYVIPSLGGEERLLLRGELINPRFSPDGQWIVASTSETTNNSILLTPAAGGTPRQLARDFYYARFDAWSPDGKQILVTASKAMGDVIDWWIVPLDGGAPVQTGAREVLRKIHGVGMIPGPTEWLDGYLLYSVGNLWRIRVASTGKIDGEPERLTAGSGSEFRPRAIAAASGKSGDWRVVFASGQASVNLWSLPLDLNAGKISGEPRKITQDAVRRLSPSLSADGKRLTYIIRGLDDFSIRVREMSTGAETTLFQQASDMRARISPDGNEVAYNSRGTDEKNTTIYLVSTSGGGSRILCDTCGLLYNWTPDGKKIVFRSGNPMKFSTVDIQTRRQQVVVSDPKYHIHGAEYSPDERWLAFHFAPNVETARAIYVTPVRNGEAADRREWIPIMDRPGTQTRPWWSPDGNVLYFLSTSGGKTDIWAQRLQPATKRPAGEPFRIYSTPTERYHMQANPWFGPAIGKKGLIFPIYESTGNVWLAE